MIYIGDAISLCFYPLSGYLADNVLERYKIMITRIIFFYIIACIVTIITVIISVVIASLIRPSVWMRS